MQRSLLCMVTGSLASIHHKWTHCIILNMSSHLKYIANIFWLTTATHPPVGGWRLSFLPWLILQYCKIISLSNFVLVHCRVLLVFEYFTFFSQLKRAQFPEVQPGSTTGATWHVTRDHGPVFPHYVMYNWSPPHPPPGYHSIKITYNRII